MDRYTHLVVADVAGALETLPARPDDLAKVEERATGTDGARVGGRGTERATGQESGVGGPVFMRMVAPTSGLFVSAHVR